MGAASIAAEVEGVGDKAVSAQTIRRTLLQIGLHGCHPRRNASSKDDALCIIFRRGIFTASSLLKTSRLRTWIIGTMSCGLMRPR